MTSVSIRTRIICCLFVAVVVAALSVLRVEGFLIPDIARENPGPAIAGMTSLTAAASQPGNVNHGRIVSFQDRVRYQRAIEEVYWRHRLWPKEGTDVKPALDAVMTQAQLEHKVTNYERESQALEDYWHRPITADQLQAEMDRMAQHTKQPEVLQELFDALGNDPFVIAECLARPVLAERLLMSSYAYDQKIHGGLRHRAEADLHAHNSVQQMEQLTGKYSQIDFVKSDSSEEVAKPDPDHAVKLNPGDWDRNARELAATLNKSSGVTDYENLPVGKLSSLQEDANGYYAKAVLEKRKDRLKVATVAWQKKPLGCWLPTIEKQLPSTLAAASANYMLPNVSDGATCSDDTWRATDGLPDARTGHTAVWTGSEMIVWGGQNYSSVFNTGARYNPSTDSWTNIASDNAPTARGGHTAVWTGMEMIVWGGYHSGSRRSGGRYNPATNSWTATSITNAPSGRSGHTAVWTGTEMIVWGGHSNETSNYLNSGGRYNPHTDSWTATTTANAPDGRESHTAVWTGSEMIVWGGDSCCPTYFNTGGRYNPATNTWTATSITDAPTARNGHTAVWTGSEMIIWGGGDDTGGRYNPSADTWAPTSTANAPSGQVGHTAVWTGSEMIIWRGLAVVGGRYNPSTNSWTPISSINAPTPRGRDTAVWTGLEMIVWGGEADGLILLNSGGRYNPSTDSWTPTAPANVPSARADHTAVWTGSEMIIWGGDNTGGKYNPSTDSWLPTSTINAPTGRSGPTAVWTGSEMIVWGGYGDEHYFNTGGRYNPVTDTWISTTTTNTPTARYRHTAVWTGSEMIVWGGADGADNLNTGGRYNPTTDSWIETTTTNAPAARAWHTSVWTGTEMIVWGGSGTTIFNTGGRYNPTTDSWISTSTINAPPARSGHAAVWTGFEMIVWLGDGGKYNPATDSWTPISTANAPDGQLLTTTSVWTGSEMIVWGGNGDCAFNMCPTNTGGRYNPTTDSWKATSLTNAPAARAFHTAVWTGNEMIVWGGYDYLDAFNTGGRYCAQQPSLLSRLGNISTRAFVQRGDNVMIGGFIVQGSQTKRVIIRAIGPELVRYGVPNPLFNPTLELHDNTGALIASNDNWTTTIIGGIITGNQVAEIRQSGHAPSDGRESAIIAELPPGNYTAIVRGVNNMTGVALVETYDLNPEANSILANISTRSLTQTGDDVMIGGFIVHGTGAKKVIIRAIGPELSAPPYNIPNGLRNPTLELHDSTGAVIGLNDNWQQTIIGGVITGDQYHDILDSGHAPSDGRESAIIAELPPGNYTAIVRGVNNTTGVSLVEVYDLGE